MANKLIDMHSVFGTDEIYSPASGSSSSARNFVYKDIDMSSRDSSVKAKVDVKAVKGALRNILGFYPMERVLLPDFGNKLHRELYEGINASNNEKIGHELRECIRKYEPRIVIDQVLYNTTTDEIDNNTVHLQVKYHIVGLETANYSEDLLYHVS